MWEGQLIRFLAIIVLSFVLAVTSARAEDLGDCYKGARAQEAGNHDLAVDQYTRCINGGELTVKNLALAYNNRGLAYRHKREYDQAIRDYDEAIRLVPDYAIAYNNRGRVYRDKIDYEQAIRDYDEAIRLDPELAFAYYNRGVAHYYMREYDQAIRDYDEAIRLDPNYGNAYYNRGTASLDKGDHDQAIRDYDEAIRLDPEYAGAYYNRGKAYSQMGHEELAILDYDKAIRLDPGIAQTYSDYTEAIRRKPDRADAPYAEALVTGKLQAIPATTSSPPTAQALELAPPRVSEANHRSFAIHLASVRTEDGAEVEWKRLQKQFPELLTRRDLIIRTVDLEARGTFFRVLTGPFEDRTNAQNLCGEFKSREQDCLAVHLPNVP